MGATATTPGWARGLLRQCSHSLSSQYQEHRHVHVTLTLGTRRAAGVPAGNLGGADVKTTSRSVSTANHAQGLRTLHSKKSASLKNQSPQ